MRRTCGYIAAIAALIGLRFSIKNQSHFAAKNDVGGFFCVPVIGIERIRAVLPNVGVAKTLLQQACREFFLISLRVHVNWILQPKFRFPHDSIISQHGRIYGLLKQRRPPCFRFWQRKKKGALSSGEKIVRNRPPSLQTCARVGWGRRRCSAVAAMAVFAHSRWSILHGVVGWNGEQRGAGS
jgi:hypothetical protein